MGLRISTNVASINGRRHLSKGQIDMGTAMGQLSSGSRINKAADDAAGLAISETFRGYIRSIRQANRNANDGISLVQVAEGAFNEIGNIIVRLRELAMQAASDTIGNKERKFIDKEVKQLSNEIERIANTTTWSDVKLLDGSTQNFDFQVGLFNNEFEDRITYEADKSMATLESLGIESLDFTSKYQAQQSLQKLDDAQTEVNDSRSNLGAIQNRLFSTLNNLGVYEENLSAATSRIKDTDIAQATADLAKSQIMLKTNVSTLANANQQTQLALGLLK